MAARKKQLRKHEVRAALSNFTLAKAKSALTLWPALEILIQTI